MFSVQHNFSLDDLTRLMSLALKTWSAGRAKFECVRINCDSQGITSGCAFIRPGVAAPGAKSRTVNLTHDLICRGIYEAARAEGIPLAPESLVFRYLEGRGYGGASTVTATALAASGEELEEEESNEFAPTSENAEDRSEAIQFPAPVSVFFDPKELKELLKTAAKRSGYEATSVTIFYDQLGATSASISIRTGAPQSTSTSTITLSPEQLKQKLTEELDTQGYIVAETEKAFRYTNAQSSFGNPGGTSLEVTIMALPNH